MIKTKMVNSTTIMSNRLYCFGFEEDDEKIKQIKADDRHEIDAAYIADESDAYMIPLMKCVVVIVTKQICLIDNIAVIMNVKK